MTTALYAVLCTAGYGLTPDAIRGLSPRQVAAIYQHPRDKDGQVVVPSAPAESLTLEQQVARLRSAAASLGIPAEQVRRAEETLRARHGNP